MLRRILIASAIILLLGGLAGFFVVRQIVFGNAPTIRHSAHQPGLSASPCATISAASGLQAFSINSSMSDASYDAHFQVAGQTLPGTVTGATGDVSGEFLLTPGANPTLTSMKILVDLRTLDSGASERDAHVRNDTLETNKYPYAIFTVSASQVIATGYSDGQNAIFTLKGALELHGVTHPVTFAMQAKLAGDSVSGSGTTLIHLQDYKMVPPATTSVVTITVSKDITLMIHFTAQRESCTHLF